MALLNQWANLMILHTGWPEAMDQDKAAFRRFFHSCLEGGVYVAPSPFEAGFLSLAHTESDIEETATVMARALVA